MKVLTSFCPLLGLLIRQCITAPLAIIYLMVIKFRIFLYKTGIFKSYLLPGVTISVGNITVGGTGKTPLVIALAEHLKQLGHSPVILTRGYRSGLDSSDSMVLLGKDVIMAPRKPSNYHADEAMMQAIELRDVPVVIGRHRHLAAQRFLAQYPTPSHWILDDGFQHIRIKRHIDIVLLDNSRPFDNGFVLPLGKLREPPTALGRASMAFFTRAHATHQPPTAAIDLLKRLRIPFVHVPFVNDTPVQMSGLPTNYATLKHIAVVTAIADPTQILTYPSTHNQNVIAQLVKNDHRRFSTDEIVNIAADAQAILTTAKDYHRDPTVFHAATQPVFVLPLRIQCSFEQFDRLLDFPV